MASTSYLALAPLKFISMNYAIWARKMKIYLRSYDICEVVEISREKNPLPMNPTLAQIKYHSEESAKKYKTLFALQSCVQGQICIGIMSYNSPKEAWTS